MISGKLAFRVSLIGAVIVMGLAGAAKLLPAVQACGGLDPHYDPVTAFELARSGDDLRAIFGATTGPCRTNITAHIDTVDMVDSIIYIPAYTVFLFFMLLGLIRSPAANPSPQPPLAKFVPALAIPLVAFAADYLENWCLFQLKSDPDTVTVWLSVLIAATNVKWVGIGIATFVCAVLVFLRDGWPRVFTPIICIGPAVTVAAAFRPAAFGPWLITSLAISWVPLLIVGAEWAFKRVRPVAQP
ncbi:MAG TPA: hypothetical protein VG942_07875 [Hyphomonadaceae bacterium]|nr:hypothetical protein [Hyphomonadaceae bacterium]